MLKLGQKAFHRALGLSGTITGHATYANGQNHYELTIRTPDGSTSIGWYAESELTDDESVMRNK